MVRRYGRGRAVRCVDCLCQDEDIWDDTELIKAYDDAVKAYKVALYFFSCVQIPTG